MSLTYQRGDLMKVKRSADEVVVVTTNGTIKKDGACVMGRGIARQVRDSIPGIDKRLGRLLSLYGNRPFRLDPTLWTLPVKHQWFDKADPRLIESSLDHLAIMVRKFEPKIIRLPMPGCGNGGLKWEEDGIQEMVSLFADNIGEICHVEVWDYELQSTR